MSTTKKALGSTVFKRHDQGGAITRVIAPLVERKISKKSGMLLRKLYPTDAAGKKNAASIKAPSKPKSAYVLFGAEERPKVRKDGMTGAEVTKLVATNWKALSAEDKKRFEEEAKKQKARYNSEMENFLFTEDGKTWQKEQEAKKEQARARAAAKKADKEAASAPPKQKSRVKAVVSRTTAATPDLVSVSESPPMEKKQKKLTAFKLFMGDRRPNMGMEQFDEEAVAKAWDEWEVLPPPRKEVYAECAAMLAGGKSKEAAALHLSAAIDEQSSSESESE